MLRIGLRRAQDNRLTRYNVPNSSMRNIARAALFCFRGRHVETHFDGGAEVKQQPSILEALQAAIDATFPQHGVCEARHVDIVQIEQPHGFFDSLTKHPQVKHVEQ